VLDDAFEQKLRSCSLGTAALPTQTLVDVLANGATPLAGVDGHLLLWSGEDQAIILRD
jgi:hypothetical protein